LTNLSETPSLVGPTSLAISYLITFGPSHLSLIHFFHLLKNQVRKQTSIFSTLSRAILSHLPNSTNLKHAILFHEHQFVNTRKLSQFVIRIPLFSLTRNNNNKGVNPHFHFSEGMHNPWLRLSR
jgi:hypothetical protein